MKYNTLQLTNNKSVVRIAFNRPSVMNAINQEMISEITDAFNKLNKDESARIIIIEGNGQSFSAGADLDYMKESGRLNIKQNIEQGLKLGKMYQSIERCTKPVIAKAHGYAIGGGFGFMVLADIAIAETKTKFSLSEVKLGINPTVIGPFVLKKIGLSHFKSLGVTGESINTSRALQIGLIHEIADEDKLEDAVIRKVNLLLKASPNAIAEFKRNYGNRNLEDSAAQ